MIQSGFEIPGQDKSLRLLKDIIKSKRIPHAFLFTGPEGVGKHFAAKEFFRYLNAEALKNNSAPELQKILNLNEPYIKFIFPLPRGKSETADDGPYDKLTDNQMAIVKEEFEKKVANPYHRMHIPDASSIKINSIREIRRAMMLDYSDMPYRGIIIEDAHLMNDEAQNALLKNLEEPPDGIIFILCTSRKDFLLTTIHSRCWEIPFVGLSQKIVENILTEKFGIDSQEAAKISLFSDGSVTKAISLSERDLDSIQQDVLQVLRQAVAGNIATAYLTLNELFSDSSDSDKLFFIELLLKWMRDVISCSNGGEVIYYVNLNDTVRKFASLYPKERIEQFLVRLDYYNYLFNTNTSLNLIIMNIIFDINLISKR